MKHIHFDTSSPTPLYFQLKEYLTKLIDTGEYPAGSALPPERELIESTGLSRTTVRQAVQMLVNEGRLERRRGVGTYVRSNAAQVWDLNHISSFRQEMERSGKTVDTKVLSMDLVENSGPLANIFNPEEHQLYRMERLRSVDGKPLVVSTTYVPKNRTPGLDKFDFSTQSLFDIMESEYYINLHHSKKALQAELVSASDAELLGIHRGAPIQHIETTTYDTTGHVVEYSVSRELGRLITYRITIIRS